MNTATTHPSGMGIDVRREPNDYVRGVVLLVENARWELAAYSAARPMREFVEFAEPRSNSDIAGMPEYPAVAELAAEYLRRLWGSVPATTARLEFAEKAAAALLATPLPAVRYSRQQVSASEQQQWSDARKIYASAARP